jgi:glycolate oxidase
VPGPKSKDDLLIDLAQIVGEENVLIKGELFDKCSKDATEIVHLPDAAVVLKNPEDIPELIRTVERHNSCLIARGAGTGLSGGALAEQGGVVLALDTLNHVLTIDSEKRVAVVEPGVITQDLADRAAAVGLFYPPDPASVAESSIGGNVAECAGGLQCKKYGVTKDYVLGIEGYDGEGSLVRTGYFAEDETYNLGSLLVGSEGTLLIITKIALQLIEPPEARRTFLAAFSAQQDAASVVAEIMAAGIIPAVLEFMDGDAVACSLEYLKNREDITDADEPPVSPGVDALLLLELVGSPSIVERDRDRVAEIVQNHNPVKFAETEDQHRREYLWTLRRSLSKAVTAAAPLRISEDVCVPPSKFPGLVSSVLPFGVKYDLRVNSYGHAGDGNLHVNFLSSEDTPAAQERISRAAADLFRTTVALEGTISGEHGIGICKRDYLALEIAPPAMDVLRRIKSAFDPDKVINPGKIFK